MKLKVVVEIGLYLGENRKKDRTNLQNLINLLCFWYLNITSKKINFYNLFPKHSYAILIIILF